MEKKICFLKGDSSNESELRFHDIACGRLASSYPAIPELNARVIFLSSSSFSAYSYYLFLLSYIC